MSLTPWHFMAALALPLAGLLVAELRGTRSWVVVLKPLASLVFVVCGALLLPLPDRSSVLLLVGLVLSFVGDVLLIPKGKKTTFLLGLGAFLCAHVAYAIAFVVHGVQTRGTLVGALALILAGVPLARWLFTHVHGAMRPPVAGYVVAITAMVALAIGATAEGARMTLAIGAALFYASDLCVARERFVTRSMWNGIVGLPLYYVAQVLLVDGLLPP
jgi:uncharacterized membrane protein YhhN